MTGPFQDYLILCAGPKTTHLLERMTYKDVLEKMLLFSRINWDTFSIYCTVMLCYVKENEYQVCFIKRLNKQL